MNNTAVNPKRMGYVETALRLAMWVNGVEEQVVGAKITDDMIPPDSVAANLMVSRLIPLPTYASSELEARAVLAWLAIRVSLDTIRTSARDGHLNLPSTSIANVMDYLQARKTFRCMCQSFGQEWILEHMSQIICEVNLL